MKSSASLSVFCALLILTCLFVVTPASATEVPNGADTSTPLGVTYTAACLVLTKQANNSAQHYDWVIRTNFPNKTECDKFEGVLNTRVLPHSGTTGLTATTVAADCDCAEAIDRGRVKYYNPSTAQQAPQE